MRTETTRRNLPLFETLIFLCFAFFAQGAQVQAGVNGETRFNLVLGSVVVQEGNGSEWYEAQANYPLGPGDLIWSNSRSRAEIVAPNGVVLRLHELTSLALETLPETDGTEVMRVSLEEGKLYVHSGSYGGQAVVEVDLGDAMLRSKGESLYRVDNSEDGTTQIFVHRGEVILESDFGAARLWPGDLYDLTQGVRLVAAHLPLKDDFDLWSMARDDVLFRLQVSQRYVPREVVRLYPDLDAYGSWRYADTYGDVWVPRVGPRWRPFLWGRWAYWRGNYTWISHEPWGWVPFHYGRWVYSPGIGWFWVPPRSRRVFWNPGAVAWYTDPFHIYWEPLAPRVAYSGRGRANHRNRNRSHGLVRSEKNRFFRGGYARASFGRDHRRGRERLVHSATPKVNTALYRTTPNRLNRDSNSLPPRRIRSASSRDEERLRNRGASNRRGNKGRRLKERSLAQERSRVRGAESKRRTRKIEREIGTRPYQSRKRNNGNVRTWRPRRNNATAPKARSGIERQARSWPGRAISNPRVSRKADERRVKRFSANDRRYRGRSNERFASRRPDSRNRKSMRRSDREERNRARAVQSTPRSRQKEPRKEIARTRSRDRDSRSVRAKKRGRDYATPRASQRQSRREKKRNLRPFEKQKRYDARLAVGGRNPYSDYGMNQHRSSRHMSEKRAKSRPERKVWNNRVGRRPERNLAKGDQKRGRQERDRRERQIRSGSRNSDRHFAKNRQKQGRQRERLISMKGRRNKRSR